MPLSEIKKAYPNVMRLLHEYGVSADRDDITLANCIDLIGEEVLHDLGSNRQHLMDSLYALLANRNLDVGIHSLTILGGRNKEGIAENVSLTLVRGSITSIVGPTGSGKSRLLADIEWMAQGDTPTGRRILINDTPPSPEDRFSLERRLVAQLSQNMNFVMDATVGEFIRMHAESRGRHDLTVVDAIIDHANTLAGEPFTLRTPITSLSGGQSRALMIADTAFLSVSPVVLVDEIENAGIDRHRAMELLSNQEKIVLIATHDPLLALTAERRLVIRNGGIRCIVQTNRREKQILAELETLDAKLTGLRQRLRMGQTIEEI